MTTEQKLTVYVNEHVLYEWLMLRYTKQRLEVGGDQLLWNAMFSAFNVSMRNVYDFFFSKDSRCIGVGDFKDYCGAFRADRKEAIAGTLDRLHGHCFHFGKRRPKVRDEKVTLERISQLFKWADSNMQAFVESLAFKNSIDLGRVDLDRQIKSSRLMLELPTRASATNVPESITTSSFGQVMSLKVDHK
jgi:hypothetical protein